MKKFLLFLLIATLAVALSLMVLSSCEFEEDPTIPEENVNTEIYSVYVAYAENVTANGGTPLDYEEWLASIKGEKGDKGDPGEKGEKGDPGEKGDQGIPGKDGADGLDGTNGADGLDGTNGTNGTDGKDGLTPFIGTNGNWWIGETDTGIKAKGENGKDGTNGTNGTDGKDGTNGTNGTDGSDGKDGTNGTDGKDGNGIEKIEKTSGEGGVDTYTIYFTDKTTTTFTITNGTDGKDYEPAKITITFNTDGGEIGNYESLGLSDAKDGIYNIDLLVGQAINMLPCPTKLGYEFTGWYTGTGVNDGQWYNGASFGASATLVARWIDASYSISYSLNGGVFDDEVSNPTKYRSSDNAFTLANPVRNGFNFIGWSGTGINGTSTSVTIAKGSTGDRSYSANWQMKPSFNLSFDLNGGTSGYTYPTKYTASDASIAVPNPTRYNYRFLGWTGTDLTEKTKDLVIESGSIGDRSYKANWTLCAVHKYADEYTCHDRECIYCGVVTKATTEHDWDASTGKCKTCGDECSHDYVEGVCDICGYVHTAHIYADEYTCHDRWCTICYAKLAATTEHDLDANCMCKDCKDYSHDYKDGKCSRCQSVQEYTRDGNYIYFGSYPQTEVTDSTIVTALNGKAENGEWTSYKYYINGSNSTDYMWYQDVEYSGNKYRGVYFTSYRPYRISDSGSSGNSNQDDNGYTTGNMYWFKYEPIKWRILEESNGYATILAELILDSQDYNHSWNNNYANSSIRAWLNDTFYNTAFTALQKELIQTVEVDNSARSTNPDNNATCWNDGNNGYACANTNDKVWLLSEQEVTRSTYGFATDPGTYDSARQKKTTAYAQCQGAYTYSGGSYDGNGWWWLRSPCCSDFYYVWDVNSYGISYSNDVRDTNGGVVPALKIRLS